MALTIVHSASAALHLGRDSPAARVFWASTTDRPVFATGNQPCSQCGWIATDEKDVLVGEGKVGGDGAAHLIPPQTFGVGFYRVVFSRAGVNVSTTTAAVLRDPEDCECPGHCGACASLPLSGAVVRVQTNACMNSSSHPPFHQEKHLLCCFRKSTIHQPAHQPTDQQTHTTP